MKNVSIGIDVGGTNTVIGVVDREGKVLVKDSIKTPAHGNINQFIDDITKSCATWFMPLLPQSED